MSYINLNEVTSKDDAELHMSFSEDKLEVFARTDVVIELTCGEYEFTTVLAAGTSLQYRKLGIHVLVYGSTGEVISVSQPTHVRYDHGIFSIKYQRHYAEDPMVATVDLSHDWDNGCDLISLQLHPNNGQYKGSRSTQTFGLVLYKNNPLVKLLKKAHRKGAGAVNLTPEGVFFYVPGESPEQQRNTGKRAEALHTLVSPMFGSITTPAKVLKKLGIAR